MGEWFLLRTSAVILDERIINTIARWLHLHDCDGCRDTASRSWGPDPLDYGDAFQEGYRREARRLAQELLRENECQQREAARQREAGDGEVPEPSADGA